MKFKRSKYISVFFFVSFFISFSANIGLASIVTPPLQADQKTHDHLRVTEQMPSSTIADLLFEENENEDENEFEADLSQGLVPFFLTTFSFQNTLDLFHDPIVTVAKTEAPIYIKVANFRI
jgi:hypothetical protein